MSAFLFRGADFFLMGKVLVFDDAYSVGGYVRTLFMASALRAMQFHRQLIVLGTFVFKLLSHGVSPQATNVTSLRDDLEIRRGFYLVPQGCELQRIQHPRGAGSDPPRCVRKVK
jgi:hypothetical protein